MPILTPAQKDTLAARLAQPDVAGLPDADAAALLSAPVPVANPAPPAQMPKPFATRDLMGVLDTAALSRLQALPSLARLLDDVALGDPGRLDNWIALLESGGTITAAQAQAIRAVYMATEPDPAYQAQIPGPSWAQATFPGVTFALPDGHTVLGQLTPEIIQEARI